MTSIPFNAAAAAYGNAARLMNEAAKAGASPIAAPGQGGDFAKLLAESVQTVVDSGKISDQKAMDMVNGKGDIVDVVTAISQTEMAIETMVSVRDRVINAYEEIMRMPI
jgi:flagellar hook-basal body complex protein FliE